MIDIEAQTLTIKNGKKLNLNDITFLDVYYEDAFSVKADTGKVQWWVDLCVKGQRISLKYDNVEEILGLAQAIAMAKGNFNRLKMYWYEDEHNKIIA